MTPVRDQEPTLMNSPELGNVTHTILTGTVLQCQCLRTLRLAPGNKTVAPTAHNDDVGMALRLGGSIAGQLRLASGRDPASGGPRADGTSPERHQAITRRGRPQRDHDVPVPATVRSRERKAVRLARPVLRRCVLPRRPWKGPARPTPRAGVTWRDSTAQQQQGQ